MDKLSLLYMERRFNIYSIIWRISIIWRYLQTSEEILNSSEDNLK